MMQKQLQSACHLYDDEGNIIDIAGLLVEEASEVSSKHMKGFLNTRSREPLDPSLQKELLELDCSQLLFSTTADASEIRGVNLPCGKRPDQCSISVLRDFIAARGGRISENKPQLIKIVKQHLLLDPR